MDGVTWMLIRFFPSFRPTKTGPVSLHFVKESWTVRGEGVLGTSA
jgi:hypothetical protein